MCETCKGEGVIDLPFGGCATCPECNGTGLDHKTEE